MISTKDRKTLQRNDICKRSQIGRIFAKDHRYKRYSQKISDKIDQYKRS